MLIESTGSCPWLKFARSIDGAVVSVENKNGSTRKVIGPNHTIVPGRWDDELWLDTFTRQDDGSWKKDKYSAAQIAAQMEIEDGVEEHGGCVLALCGVDVPVIPTEYTHGSITVNPLNDPHGFDYE